MGILIDAPFIAHSELTNEIYVIDKKAKYCVTDQVIKAVVATNRAIPKDQYEARLKADMVAMLEELKEQLREMHEDFFEMERFDEAYGVSDSMDVIQQKIKALEKI